VLKGDIQGGQRDFVLFNTSAGLVLGNLATDLKDGIAKAADEVDSGRAWKKVEQVREFSRSQGIARKPGKDEKPVRVKVDTDWIRKQKEKQEADISKRPSSIHSSDRVSHPTQLLKPPLPPPKKGENT
jgi:hypothetical protein